MKAQETNAHGILEGTKVFTVPIFQRRYSWKLDQWEALWSDICDQYEAVADPTVPSERGGHFLGSVVLHPDTERSSTVSQYMVIDGQQRLTTLLILIAALRDSRKANEPEWAASSYAESYNNQYLRNAYSAKSPAKLLPTEFDREPYASTVYNGEPVGTIGQAYVWFKRAIESLREKSPNFDYDDLADAILLRLNFVEIRTDESDSVNSIFNTLNSKGLPLSPVDLIRNEFMWALGANAGSAYSKYWSPMEKRLESSDDDRFMLNYLWAQSVRRDPKVTQRELFDPFASYIAKERDHHGRDGVLAALEHLYNEHTLYAALNVDDRYDGLARNLSEDLRSRVDAMYLWGSAPHVPVTLDVMSRVAAGDSPDESGQRALDALLSFLVRRALVGLPSNNLNRMLTAGPASFEKSSPIDRQLVTFLLKFERAWPTDAELVTIGATSPVYATLKRSQALFILRSLRDSTFYAGAEKTRIAHVIPAKLTAEWNSYFTNQGVATRDVSPLANTLGNLVLVNVPLTRIPKDPGERIAWIQRNAEGPHLNLVTGENLAEQVAERSRLMLADAVRIWPHPGDAVSPETTEPEVAPLSRRVSDLLMSIRDGNWTTDATIASVLGAKVEDVRALVASTGAESARFVLSDSGDIPTWFSDELAAAVHRQQELLDIPTERETPLDEAELASLITAEDEIDLEEQMDESE